MYDSLNFVPQEMLKVIRKVKGHVTLIASNSVNTST